jgi:hypothetical protein
MSIYPADPAEAYEQEMEARFAPLDKPDKQARQPCDHEEPCTGCGHYAEHDDEEQA